MKNLEEYINESKSGKVLEPENVKLYINKGINHNSEEVTVIGKPFTNENDENYAVAKKILGDAQIKLVHTLEDAYHNNENAEEIDYWAIALNNEGEAEVVEYGPDGVQIYVK